MRLRLVDSPKVAAIWERLAKATPRACPDHPEARLLRTIRVSSDDGEAAQVTFDCGCRVAASVRRELAS